MAKWNPWKIDVQDEVIETSAAAEIRVPRQAIWELIKPAENALLFDPTTVRAFKAEGTPRGVGEIQVFISMIDGREHISALEITHEVAGEYAITRSIGSGDFAPRIGFYLSDTTTGTRLEQRYSLIVPKFQASNARMYTHHYKKAAQSFVQRVKVIAEHRWQSTN